VSRTVRDTWAPLPGWLAGRRHVTDLALAAAGWAATLAAAIAAIPRTGGRSCRSPSRPPGSPSRWARALFSPPGR
jgi:hypothetical protein